MAIFEKEHYGKKISPELSEILKNLINRDDLIEECKSSGLSYNTVWTVICGTQNVTKRNGDAIKRLILKAHGVTIERPKADKERNKYLTKFIKTFK